MATNAKATGFLELNITGFEQAIKTAKNLMVTFAAGFTAYKIGTFFKDGIKDAIDFGREMASASRVMGGFDAGNILLVQKALEKSGQGAEEARGHIADFLNQGRSLSDLFGGAENYAAALKSAAADYGSQAGVLTRSAKALQTVWNTMEAIGAKVRTFFMEMTEQFVKPLQGALEYLNALDMPGIGAAFGKAIADATALLLGIFKNGDMFKIIQLGIGLAFKTAVNFLYDGFLYLGNVIVPAVGSKLYNALKTGIKYAIDYLVAAFNFIFSEKGMTAIFESFVGISAKFLSAMLGAVNTIVRVLGAGVAYAIQAAIDAIPGLSKLIGNSSFGSITEAYDATEGIIPQDFIDSINQAGNDFAGKFGEGFDEAVAGIKATFSQDDRASGSIFDTSKDKEALSDMIAKAFKTGQKAIDGVDSSTHAAPKGALGQFQSDRAHSIADSLQKVGGGGNYIMAGQSLAQRQLAATERGAKANEEIRDFMRTTYGYTKNPKPIPLGR